MQFMPSSPDTLTNVDVEENENVAYEQAPTETNNENHSVETPLSTNQEQDSTSTSETISILLGEPVKSEKKLQPFRDEENADIEYNLENKNRFVLRLKTIDSLSSMTSYVIKNQASLPTDIQHLLFLKMISISRDLVPMDMHNLSRHFYNLIDYLSNIHSQEVLFTYHMEKVSLNIDPEEISRMSERKNESTLKSKVNSCHQTLIKCINPSVYILKTLVTEGVLTSQQMAVVGSKPSSEIRAEELLSILSNSEHPKAFSIFKESLQRDHAEIVWMIDETELHSDEELDAKKEVSNLSTDD